MMLVMGVLLLLMLILSLASGVVMIVGGLKMLRLQSYGWAMTACVVAVLPFNPVGFIGLIIGIWGLVVLNQPSVRAAFRGTAALPASLQRAENPNPLAWIILAMAFFAAAALVPVVIILAYFKMRL